MKGTHHFCSQWSFKSYYCIRILSQHAASICKGPDLLLCRAEMLVLSGLCLCMLSQKASQLNCKIRIHQQNISGGSECVQINASVKIWEDEKLTGNLFFYPSMSKSSWENPGFSGTTKFLLSSVQPRCHFEFELCLFLVADIFFHVHNAVKESLVHCKC